MYLKTALSNIRRSPFQAIVVCMVLSITFFVATIIATLIYSSAQVVSFFEQRPQVIAFLKNDAKQDDIVMFENKLKSDQRVKDVKFVSQEGALEFYKNVTSDNPLLGKFVSPSTLPASIEFSLKDLNDATKIIDDIKKENFVDSVYFTASLGGESNQKDIINKLTKATLYIRIGGLVLASVLAVTSFLVLMVIISMRIATKRGEIETLKIMGATSGFIKTPLVIEAIIYVTMGVLIGWVLAVVLVLYAAPTIINFFAAIPVLPKQNIEFLKLMLAILSGELFVGLVIAISGGWTAVTRAISK